MRFGKGALILGGSQLSNLILTFISRILLGRLLGTALYGQFGIALNAMTLASRCLSVGVAPATQVLVAKESDKGRAIGTSALFGLLVSALATITVYVTVSPLEALFFKGHPVAFKSFLVLLPFLPVVILSMNVGVMLIPLSKIKAYGQIQAGGMLPFIAIAWVGSQFVEPMQAILVSQIVVWLYLFTVMIWHLRAWRGSIGFDRLMWRFLWGFGLKAWLNTFLSIGIARFATLLGAAFLTKVEVSLFAVSLQLVEGIVAPYSAAGQLLVSRTAEDHDKGKDTTLLLLRLALPFLGVLLLVAALLAYPTLLLFGAGFAGAYPYVLVLMVAATAHALIRTYGNYFAGIGRPHLSSPALAIELIVLILGIFTICPAHGINGLVVSSISAALVGVIVSAIQMSRTAKVGWREQFVASKADFKVAMATFRSIRASSSKTTPAA